MIKFSKTIFLNLKELQWFLTFLKIYFQNYSYKTRRHFKFMYCLNYPLNPTLFYKKYFKKYSNCSNLITHKLSFDLMDCLFNLKKRIWFYFIKTNIYLSLYIFYYRLDYSYLFLLLFSLVSLIFDTFVQTISFFNLLNLI
jgi:hypothetical protein